MFDWFRKLPTWGKAATLGAGTVTAVITASFKLADAIHATEPYHYATHDFVRSEVTRGVSVAREEVKQTSARLDELRGSQIETQISLEKKEKSRVLDKIAEKELLLQQYPDIPAPLRAATEQQIRDWREDVTEANYAIDQLRGLQSGRRP